MNNQTNDVKFSVIIAVYNGAATIARAIDSILNQTQKAHELIIVDDGSTDNTAEVVLQYADGVRYIYQDNAGVSAARNNGVKHATGNWIAFLDADDWYYPDRIRWHGDWIKEDAQLDFLTGNFDYVKPSGELIRHSMESTPAGKYLLKQTDESRSIMSGDVIGQFIAQHFGDTHTLSVPRSTFLELGGYPTEYAVCEDVNFLIRLCAKSSRIGVVSQPMAAYAIYDQSATRSNPLRAQRQTLAALRSLRLQIVDSPNYIRTGLEDAIRHARLDLAYVLLRKNQKLGAIKSVLPLLWEKIGWQSIRDVLSILAGAL
jgi:glycosyltransferase involved in cell wall biosynthesis